MSNVFMARSQNNELPDTVWTKFTYPYAINAVKFTPDGRYLASAGDDGVPKLWDADTGELVREFQGNGWPILGIDINPDGTLIASVDKISVVTIWDIKSGEIIKVLDEYPNQKQGLDYKSIDFSNNGLYLAASIANYSTNGIEPAVFIWSTIDWSIVSKRENLINTFHIAFSPDDNNLAVSNFVIEKEKITVCIMDVPNLNIVKILGNPTEYGIQKSSFSPNNKLLASALEVIPNKIWNTSEWRLKSEIGKDAISVAFSPDSKYVVFGEGVFKKWMLNIYDNDTKKLNNSILLDWLAKKYMNIYDQGDTPLSISINKNSTKIGIGGIGGIGSVAGIYLPNAKWNPTSVEVESIQILEPEIFPNPMNGKAIIRFNLIKTSEVSVDIFDINSRLISNLYKGQLNQGIQSLNGLQKFLMEFTSLK